MPEIEFESTNESCPLCKSESKTVWKGFTSFSEFGDGAFHCANSIKIRPEVRRCLECSHYFSNKNYWNEQIRTEYEDLVDKLYLELMPAKIRTFRRAASIVNHYKVNDKPALIEIGSYTGTFLKEMMSLGFMVVGVEPSIWGANLTATHGIEVLQGRAEDILPTLNGETFDFVVSWDVLEHVIDPEMFIRMSVRVLKPGGYFIFSTLDRTNWFARLMGARWPWIIPMHLHYFNQLTIKEICESHRLEFVKTGAHVHFTNIFYAISKFLPLEKLLHSAFLKSLLKQIIFPVGFGDVRYYVFRKV
jgi:SAM-dependent methyltransferase